MGCAEQANRKWEDTVSNDFILHPPLRKDPRFKAPKYLNFIREQPCIVCDRVAQAHHVIYKSRGNWSSDLATVPLCEEHHTGINGIHTLGLEEFEARHRIYAWLEVLRMWERYYELL